MPPTLSLLFADAVSGSLTLMIPSHRLLITFGDSELHVQRDERSSRQILEHSNEAVRLNGYISELRTIGEVMLAEDFVAAAESLLRAKTALRHLKEKKKRGGDGAAVREKHASGGDGGGGEHDEANVATKRLREAFNKIGSFRDVLTDSIRAVLRDDAM